MRDIVDIDYLQLARNHLAIIFPQYSRDDIEVTICRTLRVPQFYYVAVFVKLRNAEGQVHVQLLETGPHCDNHSTALQTYTVGHLAAEVHRVAVQSKVKMLPWRDGGYLGYTAIITPETMTLAPPGAATLDFDQAGPSVSAISLPLPTNPPSYDEANGAIGI